MGLTEDLTIYWWNWMVFFAVTAGVLKCWAIGGWGLFFDDDDGELMRMCFDTYDGLHAKFPVMFESSYAEVTQ